MAAPTTLLRATSRLAPAISTKSYTPSTRWSCVPCKTRALPQSTRQFCRTFAASSPALEKKYTEDHEWIELDADGKHGTIGISTYAAKALGDVVYVELPEVDAELSAGDVMGAVESVKSASDIMAPISGKITETNSKLEETPKMINESPEDRAWIVKMKIKDAKELDGLMDLKAYKEHTGE